MKKLILAAVFALIAASAQAQYFVDPAGSDANACTNPAAPCATIQHAADLVQNGQIISITLACGTPASPLIYNGPVNIYYYRGINIASAIGCDPAAAIIRTNTAGQCNITAQDHVILGLTGVTLDTTASGNTGVCGRQFSIADIVNVHFSAFPSGGMISLTDRAIGTTAGNIWIDGGATTFLSLKRSDFTIASWVYTAGGLQFTYFLSLSMKSTLDATQGVLTGAGGGGATTATQWFLDGSELMKTSGGYLIPGNTAGNGTTVGNRVYAN